MTKATLHAAKGDVVIKLFDDHTTKTVKNFIDLAKNDFYDGTVLHRLISGFMMQGGGIQGTGTGGLGYKFDTKLHESVFMKSKQPRLVQEIDQLRRSRQIL